MLTPAEPPKPTVTVETFLNKWETMTGQKISGSKSDVASAHSSVPSADLEFDGFDLVQVLRLCTGLEDQLGILAPQVEDYFKKVLLQIVALVFSMAPYAL
jgi:hypothetical protein